MPAALSQIGLHFRHNSHVLRFWDLYGHITVYGWVVITYQDCEATDGDPALSCASATTALWGQLRSPCRPRKIVSVREREWRLKPAFTRNQVGQGCPTGLRPYKMILAGRRMDRIMGGEKVRELWLDCPLRSPLDPTGQLTFPMPEVKLVPFIRLLSL